ncbi:N-glycosylase/DNA lyase [Geosmithia morbida]|uniref:DNA-(apurinic or apyrimidinic site) lyase n=1 Tax=Geosmithia morbida TaxID=1094350 RepID=A0A9P4YXE5_9HYPO|nr:N-glycosylase/DNA lyase [Geosmithia morbida]KAF4123491.1 N-glycosylase/DNA lyase [Geosmithia morbida]
MTIKAAPEWRKLPVTLSELCIDTTLRCGQSFRWRKFDDEWRCTLYGRILALRQDPTHLHYKVTWPEASSPLSRNGKGDDDDTEALLRNYFSLRVDLGSLYEQWSKADTNFRKKAPTFTGVRILNQPAWEALVAFICSSNNNIARISQMVHKLCSHYGPLVGRVDDEAYHDFPAPADLTGSGVESHLRELGFGYRAKYIAETARIVAEEKPSDWLETIRNPAVPGFRTATAAEKKGKKGDRVATYKDAQEELLSLKGVGPKVSDCVCLMGLGWGESVPVDTHVWQIAQRDYKFGKKSKTFNKVMYDAVGDHFRALWGEYAGWAHSVLFTADLRQFADRPAVKEEVKDEGKETVAVLKTGKEEEDVGQDTKAPLRRKRKRGATNEIKTEIKIEVKVEEDVNGNVVGVEKTVKRRRTRNSMRL